MMSWLGSVSCILLVISLAMTSSKRAPRRNWTNKGLTKLTNMEEEEDGVCELEVSCKNREGIPLTLPIRGPAGPAGKPGTPGLPGKPGPAGGAESSGLDIPRVAFFAGLGKNFGPVSKNTDLVFDRVVTNVGEAYNPKNGRFTAPVTGTYSFTITVAATGGGQAAVDVMHNKKMVAIVWSTSKTAWAASTSNVIVTMETGDQVWAVVLSRASHVHGYMYTSFSGSCLFRSL